jgi:2-keto-4-pentenoate hydratase
LGEALPQDSATAAACEAIASSFVAARKAAVRLENYPGKVPLSTTEAYACQEHAIGLWPDRVAGWKVARIGPDWASQFPEPRLNGPVFARNVHITADDELPECPVFEGGFAAVETEVVIRVLKNAPADKIEWTLEESFDYIDDVFMGIEVASSPLATLNECGPGAVISDFGNNWGVVVGRPIPNWRNVRSIDCEAFIDGVSVGARPVSMEQGPLSAFVFTLGNCAARGRLLRAGVYITTGMITGVYDVWIG